VGGRHGWRRGTGTSTDGDRDGTDDRDARKPRDERRRGDEKANARERARAPSFPRAARRVESTRLVDAMIPIDGCVTMNGCESKNARGRRTSVWARSIRSRSVAGPLDADAPTRRRGSHLRFQARTRSIVRHHRWIYTGIARHRELRMPRRSHSFVFSLGRATVRLLVRDDVASDSDDATRNQVNTHRARARVVARAPCLYARLRVRPLEPTSRRRELLVPRITSTSAEPPSRRRRRPSSTARGRRARADARRRGNTTRVELFFVRRKQSEKRDCTVSPYPPRDDQ